jgi:pilus assembly protein CpaB
MQHKALLISAIATLVGVASLRAYMQRFEQRVQGGPPTEVLVLVKDAQAGTLVTTELLGTRALPQAYLESRHISASEIDQVQGARLAVAARANETLLWSDLVSMREPPRQLSSLVPEGMRALTLPLTDGTSEALLAPGDRVDVVLTGDTRANAEAPPGAETLAQGLLVLAVGDELGSVGQRHRAHPSRASHVTLSVTPAQGALLAQAERRGPLQLFVRNPDDLALTEGPRPSIGEPVEDRHRRHGEN